MRIRKIACVDDNRPVVVMSGVLRYKIFWMTRSITHVIKFSMKQTSGRRGTQLIRSGVVELLARVAIESGAAASIQLQSLRRNVHGLHHRRQNFANAALRTEVHLFYHAAMRGEVTSDDDFRRTNCQRLP